MSIQTQMTAQLYNVYGSDQGYGMVQLQPQQQQHYFDMVNGVKHVNLDLNIDHAVVPFHFDREVDKMSIRYGKPLGVGLNQASWMAISTHVARE